MDNRNRITCRGIHIFLSIFYITCRGILIFLSIFYLISVNIVIASLYYTENTRQHDRSFSVAFGSFMFSMICINIMFVCLSFEKKGDDMLGTSCFLISNILFSLIFGSILLGLYVDEIKFQNSQLNKKDKMEGKCFYYFYDQNPLRHKPLLYNLCLQNVDGDAYIFCRSIETDEFIYSKNNTVKCYYNKKDIEETLDIYYREIQYLSSRNKNLTTAILYSYYYVFIVFLMLVAINYCNQINSDRHPIPADNPRPRPRPILEQIQSNSPKTVSKATKSEEIYLDQIKHGNICVICQETIEYQNIYNLNCGHGKLFHMQCIDNWMKQSNICPYCRQEIELTVNLP